MVASSLTSTLVSPAVAPRHGKLVPHSSPEAMDVTRDEHHLSHRDQAAPHADLMDTSWDGANKGLGQVKIPGLLLGEEEATTTTTTVQPHQQQQQPPQPPILERPREESNSDDTQHAAITTSTSTTSAATTATATATTTSQLASLPDHTTATTSQSTSTSQTIPPSQSTSVAQTASSPPSITTSAPLTTSTSQTSSLPQMASKPPPPQNAPLVQNPLLTSNLISLYGLDDLAATVARTDPQTGEKINKMRKSYEGQLKTFTLSGRNKSVKHDPSKGMGLAEMAAWPEEEWQNQKVHGKSIKDGMPEAMKAKLEKAMAMLPGPVPENEKWEDLLGIEKVKATDTNKDKNVKNGAPAAKLSGQQPNGVRPPNNTTSNNNNNSQASEPIRARRTTKKRRYDDGSFEGYGEGYVDDDMEGGYTSGESRSTKNSAGNRKRRKTKDFGNNSADYGSSRNNSFTAGPVGISASYGR